jgi:hypothetical protein
MTDPASYSGVVVKRRWSVGSKSEHEAVCLQTGSQLLKLRRAGANPFQDAELQQLVGETIDVEGTLLDSNTLLITTLRRR